jgi:hypothetical protein
VARFDVFDCIMLPAIAPQSSPRSRDISITGVDNTHLGATQTLALTIFRTAEAVVRRGILRNKRDLALLSLLLTVSASPA